VSISIILSGELVNKTNLMNVIACVHELASLAEKKGFTPVLKRTEGMPGTIYNIPSPIDKTLSSNRKNWFKKWTRLEKST
jgi:hypothetical protein